MKLGRLPHNPARYAALPSFLRARFAYRQPPPVLDRRGVPFAPRMFDNDTLPDCTAAALANAALAVSALNGFETSILDALVPAFYADCIGQPLANLAELATTDGAVASEVLAWQYANGFTAGQQAPLGALFGTVPLTRDVLARGMADLGHGYWGVTLTERDMETAGTSAAWDDNGTTPQGNVVGGHMICAWDYLGLRDEDTVRVATWGALKPATWRWVARRLQEAYCLVWRQLATTGGLDMHVDVDALDAELMGLVA